MQTIALVSTKGGAGKTCTAVGLAVEAGADLVIDLDPQASACRWGDRREAPATAVTDVAPARRERALEAAAGHGISRVIIDSPPRSESAAVEAARMADLVVVPVRPQLLELETVPATQRLLALAGDPRAVVVLTAVPPRGRRAAEARQAVERFGLPVCVHDLGYRAAWGDAVALGLVPTEYQPRSRAAAELRALGQWVVRVLGRPSLIDELQHAEA